MARFRVEDRRLQFGHWGEYKYRTFISYSHIDSPWADRLERALNDFILPRELEHLWTEFGPPPRRLKPHFRDRGSQGAHHSLDTAIAEALKDSASLIVVCSPHSAQSDHVDREIQHFQRLGRQDRIFALLVDGEPKDGIDTCFPKALRFAVDDRGELDTDRPKEPLAADARPRGDGWRNAFYKIVAGMLDMDADLISRRDQRRERWERARRRVQILGALGAIVIFGLVAALTFNLTQAAWDRENQFLAARALEFFVTGARDDAILTALEGANASHGHLLKRPETPAIKDALSLILTPSPVLATFPDAGASHLAAVRDGRGLAIGYSDGRIATIDGRVGTVGLSAPTVRYRTLPGTGPITSIAVSSDSRWLAAVKQLQTLAADGAGVAPPHWMLRLWDLPTNDIAAELELQARLGVLVFARAGNFLAGGDDDGNIYLWRIPAFDAVAVIPPDESRPPHRVVDLAMSEDGTHVAAVLESGEGSWVVAIEAMPGAPVLAIQADARYAQFAQGDDTLVLLSEDGTIGHADLESGAVTPMQRLGTVIKQAVIAPGGRSIVALGDDRAVHFWQRGEDGAGPFRLMRLIPNIGSDAAMVAAINHESTLAVAANDSVRLFQPAPMIAPDEVVERACAEAGNRALLPETRELLFLDRREDRGPCVRRGLLASVTDWIDQLTQIWKTPIEPAPRKEMTNIIDPQSAPSRGLDVVNAAGLEIIKRFEGLSLESYRDVVGVWTIGYGHFRTAGPGMTITEEEAEGLLKADLESTEEAVMRLVEVPLNENEFSALVSLVYNIGERSFASSTTLRLLNQGNHVDAADAIERWNTATVGGERRVIPGLTMRRAAEKALFLTPISGEAIATGRLDVDGPVIRASDPNLNVEEEAHAEPGPPL